MGVQSEVVCKVTTSSWHPRLCRINFWNSLNMISNCSITATNSIKDQRNWSTSKHVWIGKTKGFLVAREMHHRSLFSYDFSWQLLPTLKCFRSLGIRLCLFRQIAGDLSGFSYIYWRVLFALTIAMWFCVCGLQVIRYTLIRRICAWFNYIANIWSIDWFFLFDLLESKRHVSHVQF